MKKGFFIILIIIFTGNIGFCFNYTDEDKDAFYDAFIEGYIESTIKELDKYNTDNSVKEKFERELRSKINKKELINSSWNCIKQYPLNDIISATVICTYDWTKRQTIINREIYNSIK